MKCPFGPGILEKGVCCRSRFIDHTRHHVMPAARTIRRTSIVQQPLKYVIAQQAHRYWAVVFERHPYQGCNAPRPEHTPGCDQQHYIRRRMLPAIPMNITWIDDISLEQDAHSSEDAAPTTILAGDTLNVSSEKLNMRSVRFEFS